MAHLAVAVVAVLVIVHGSFSTRLQRAPVSPPLLFLLAGLLLGADGLGLPGLGLQRRLLDPLAELTLVVVLFTDASRLDLGRLRGQVGLPGRLLGVSLPLTMLLGAAVAAWLVDGVSGWMLVLLGAVLAPTDATLAQPVVSDTRVPVRIRQTVNVESGLNDGIALPVVTLTAVAAAGGLADYGVTRFLVEQLGYGAVIGIGAGWLGGSLVDARARSGAMSVTAQQLSTLAVGVAAWAFAHALGGNGFVAAFVAGMTFGAVARERSQHLAEFAEEEGQLLVLVTWLLVGATLVGPALAAATPAVVAYALLSLTLVRMVPTALALLGSGVRWPSVLYLGWFGPRGLASLVFGLLVVERSGIPQADRLVQVVVLTVALSVLLHGVTAAPLATRYARWSRRMAEDAAEHQPAPDLPPRIRFGRDRGDEDVG